MKRSQVMVGLFAGLAAFVVMLTLDTVGPLSDDRSLGHHVLSSGTLAAAFGVAMAWSMRRSEAKAGSRVVVLDEQTAARVDALLARGKRVEAVKAVRDATGADLKSAVDTVDARR